MDIDKLSYEDSIKKLEILMEKLKSDDLKLEESINVFKEANILYDHCKELLDDAEGEIKVILEDDNELIETNFSEEDENEI